MHMHSIWQTCISMSTQPPVSAATSTMEPVQACYDDYRGSTHNFAPVGTYIHCMYLGMYWQRAQIDRLFTYIRSTKCRKLYTVGRIPDREVANLPRAFTGNFITISPVHVYAWQLALCHHSWGNTKIAWIDKTLYMYREDFKVCFTCGHRQCLRYNIPYSGKFSYGANFRIFRMLAGHMKLKNYENLNIG